MAGIIGGVMPQELQTGILADLPQLIAESPYQSACLAPQAYTESIRAGTEWFDGVANSLGYSGTKLSKVHIVKSTGTMDDINRGLHADSIEICVLSCALSEVPNAGTIAINGYSPEMSDVDITQFVSRNSRGKLKPSREYKGAFSAKDIVQAPNGRILRFFHGESHAASPMSAGVQSIKFFVEPQSGN